MLGPLSQDRWPFLQFYATSLLTTANGFAKTNANVLQARTLRFTTLGLTLSFVVRSFPIRLDPTAF